MQTNSNPNRDPRYALKHDGIYASLDLIPNWLVKGDLTFVRDTAPSEIARVKKFHLLMRDLANRYLGCRDLDGIGWFLTQECSASGKHHHFHFAITSDGIDLNRTSAAVVCTFLRKQWSKIADASQAIIEPWDDSQRERGIWYLTQYSERPLRHSSYFGGSDSHWRMSRLLQSKILELTTKEKYEPTSPIDPSTSRPISSRRQ